MEADLPPNLGTLPAEIQEQILLKADIVSMLNLCEVNKQFAIVCTNIWRLRVKEDFGLDTLPTKYPTWRDYYIALYRKEVVKIPLTQKGEEVGSVWLYNPNNAVGISDTIFEIHPKLKFEAIVVVFNSRDVKLYGRDSRSWYVDIDLSDAMFIELTNETVKPIRLVYNQKVYFFWWNVTKRWHQLVSFIRKINPSITKLSSGSGASVNINDFHQNHPIMPILKGAGFSNEELTSHKTEYYLS